MNRTNDLIIVLAQTLHRTCAEKCDPSSQCSHDNIEDRALVETWVSIELQAALDRGY